MRSFGLVGKHLSHSFSQKFFEEKFGNEKLQDCTYSNFELSDINLLPALVKRLPGLQGLNVTIPYKEAVLPFLNEADVIVRKVGACNCIHIEEGMLYGYNTDVIGFSQSLVRHLRPANRGALVLGRGGASKAVQYALQQLQLPFAVVSRNAASGEVDFAALTPEMIASHTLIVNTTPLGTFPDVAVCPPIPYETIGPEHLLFDLVYNPVETLFLKKGREQGARTCNGYDMLVAQAVESWRIWNPGSGS